MRLPRRRFHFSACSFRRLERFDRDGLPDGRPHRGGSFYCGPRGFRFVNLFLRRGRGFECGHGGHFFGSGHVFARGYCFRLGHLVGDGRERDDARLLGGWRRFRD